ncbi:MAG: SIMPL domain-containing protein [Nevskiaceae bacterium]
MAFGSTKEDEHQRAALALAAQDARANADVLANAMGVKLGKLHSLTASASGGAPPPGVFMMRAAKAESMSADQTYEAGQIRFEATVTVEYDLP